MANVLDPIADIAVPRPSSGAAVAPQLVSSVVLLSMPRTGSTMITRQLSTHPRIHFVGAVFSVLGWCGTGRDYRSLQEGLSPAWDDLDYRVANHRALLNKWFATANEGECFGLKHHLSGAVEVTEALIADPRIGKILLNRSNVLACYSSDRIVRLTEQQQASGQGQPKAVFDPQDFDRYLARRRRVYDRWRPKLENGAGPWMELEYTDARVRQGIESVVKFIGLDPTLLHRQRTLKRNSDDVVARFQNPEAVLAHLRDKGLEEFAEERSPEEQANEPETASPSPPIDPAAVARRAERRAQRQAANKVLREQRVQQAIERRRVQKS